MRNILTFTCIPTLSRHLYQIPQYIYKNYYKKDDGNKVINIVVKENAGTSFEVINNYKVFHTHANNCASNTFITSNFILKGKYNNKNIHISENTYYDSFDQTDTIMLKYDLCLKLDNYIVSNISCLENFNSNLKFTDNIWYTVSQNNYEVLKNIDKIIYNNKQNAYSSEQIIL